MTSGRAFLLAFAAFFLLGAAWATALPVNGTYDEGRHIVRAYAAADGQWLPHGDKRLSFRVPSTLLPTDQDCIWDPTPPKEPRPASCQGAAVDVGRVSTQTWVARYNPVYYLPVGLPLRVWPDTTGVILARLVSALLSALMLAAAVALAARLRSPLLVAGIALVATPTVVNLAGSVNPNGLEIAAAVLLFAALLALLRDGGPRRGPLALAGVAAATLLTVRQLGPVLLAIDLTAVAVLAGAARVRAELARRDTRAWLGGFVAAGVLIVAAWTVAVRSPVGDGPGSASGLTAGGIVRGLLSHRIEFYLRQLVGQFGYGETTISPVAVLLWYALVAVLVVPALRGTGWRIRGVVLGLAVAGFGLLVGLEFVFVPSVGWFSHGRYALPVLAGAVLIAAWADSGRRPTYLAVALVTATAPVHLYSLVRVVSRYRVGIEATLSPFSGTWEPPLGVAVPLLALVTGLTALVAAVAWVTHNTTVSSRISALPVPSTRTVSAD